VSRVADDNGSFPQSPVALNAGQLRVGLVRSGQNLAHRSAEAPVGATGAFRGPPGDFPWLLEQVEIPEKLQENRGLSVSLGGTVTSC
jgi:hypothetical protein